jgi:hypothetical protein
MPLLNGRPLGRHNPSAPGAEEGIAGRGSGESAGIPGRGWSG